MTQECRKEVIIIIPIITIIIPRPGLATSTFKQLELKKKNIRRTRGVRTRGVRTRGVRTRGVRTRGVRTRGVRTRGVRTRGVRTRGVRTRGVRTRGVRTRGVRTRGVRTRGVRTRNKGLSSDLCKKSPPLQPRSTQTTLPRKKPPPTLSSMPFRKTRRSSGWWHNSFSTKPQRSKETLAYGKKSSAPSFNFPTSSRLVDMVRLTSSLTLLVSTQGLLRSRWSTDRWILSWKNPYDNRLIGGWNSGWSRR